MIAFEFFSFSFSFTNILPSVSYTYFLCSKSVELLFKLIYFVLDYKIQPIKKKNLVTLFMEIFGNPFKL